MKKSIIVVLHIGYWIMYIFLLTVILAAGKLPVSQMLLHTPTGVGAMLPAIIGFYSAYSFLFEKFLAKKKILQFILGVALTTVIAPAITEIAIYSLFNKVDESFNTIFYVGLFLTFITAVNIIIALIMRGFVSWYDDIQLKMELNQKNYDMELALVKNQINPHFLFNTINNIDVLIQKDSIKASEYLNKLSDIMRFMLYENKADRISIETELGYIEKYIELQKIRSSNPGYVNYSIEGNTQGITIEPMLFIPFIENAFKHTENKSLENAINIKITLRKENIIFECENKLTPASKNKTEQNGLGNGLIEKRLQLLYPNSYNLDIVKEQNIYKVKLILPNVH